MSWQDYADCARHRMDPAPRLVSWSLAEYANAYCSACPVVAECAADALDHGDMGVIRAGIYLAANGPHTTARWVKEELRIRAAGG